MYGTSCLSFGTVLPFFARGLLPCQNLSDASKRLRYQTHKFTGDVCCQKLWDPSRRAPRYARRPEYALRLALDVNKPASDSGGVEQSDDSTHAKRGLFNATPKNYGTLRTGAKTWVSNAYRKNKPRANLCTAQASECGTNKLVPCARIL